MKLIANLYTATLLSSALFLLTVAPLLACDGEESETESEPIAETVNEPATEEVSDLLQQSLEKKLDTKSREKVANFIKSLLPTKGADGEAVEWRINFSGGSKFPANSQLMSATMYLKGNQNKRLMWAHILYNRNKPTSKPYKTFQGYPVARGKDVHAFLTVNHLEFRLVAADDSYKDDDKINDILISSKLKTMGKL